MRVIVVALAACGSSPPKPTPPSAPTTNEITIKKGAPITTDGALDDWHDAQTIAIEVAAGWSSTVRFKHDGERLLFAFDALGADGNFRYPEVMIDAKHDGGLEWSADDWWFHASFRDCWSSGRYNDYKSCVNEAPTWAANNYVDQKVAPKAIEIAIPITTLGAGKTIGIAFDLTDTQTMWAMWPAKAQLAVPSTWGTARIE